MRGSLDIEIGGGGAAAGNYAPLDWVIQTNEVGFYTTLSSEQRITAARNSGTWQAVAISPVSISPGIEGNSFLPVLPRKFALHGLLFTLPFAAEPLPEDLMFTAELQVMTPGGVWSSLAVYEVILVTGSYAGRIATGLLHFLEGRSYQLVVSTDAYAVNTPTDLISWVFGTWAEDLPGLA